jgi:hypothetical protein
MQVLLKSCQKCQGDLIQDGDEFRCWQCGNYYYPRIDLPELEVVAPVVDPNQNPLNLPELAKRRHRRSRWAVRDINSLIVAKDRSEQRWWSRNAEMIKFLDAGNSVREIAVLIRKSERQVRVVREQLSDLRAVTEMEQVAV